MMRKVLVAVVVAVAVSSFAAAQNILLLNEQCSGSVAYFPTALSNLGFAFTETNDDASFLTALTGGGTWDIVIVDEYANSLSGPALSALQTYIAGGGRAYMNHWEWDAATAASFGATLGASYDVPATIYRWSPADPLFSVPNAVVDLVPSDDTCGTDGALFTTAGGTAIGGYAAAPAAGQAGVIVGNGGRTVLFGGILGLFNGDADSDSTADGLEFAENVVAYLAGVTPQGNAIPTLGSVALLGLSLALAALGLLALRRA